MAAEDIDQFMHEFLVAERQLRRRFAELEKEMWVKFGVPELHPRELEEMQAKYDQFTSVETFKETGDRATVIATTVRPSEHLTRARYTLCQMNGGWRISGIEWACKLCEGTGRIRGVPDKDCIVSKGKGWFVAPSSGDCNTAGND